MQHTSRNLHCWSGLLEWKFIKISSAFSPSLNLWRLVVTNIKKLSPKSNNWLRPKFQYPVGFKQHSLQITQQTSARNSSLYHDVRQQLSWRRTLLKGPWQQMRNIGGETSLSDLFYNPLRPSQLTDPTPHTSPRIHCGCKISEQESHKVVMS